MANRKQEQEIPDWYLKLEAKYLEAVMRKQEADAEMEKVRATILGMMETDGVKSISTDLTTVKYVAPFIARKFNSTDFKQDHPDLYKQYSAEYPKNAYIQVKIK